MSIPWKFSRRDVVGAPVRRRAGQPPRDGPLTGAPSRVTVAAALAAVLAATGALPGAAAPSAAHDRAAAADTAPPQVEDLWFSRDSVRVSGLAVVAVTVSVHLIDASGVKETTSGMDPSPQLTLSPVPGFRSRLSPSLTRTSGTVRDGVWSATVNVPSTWHGTVRISSVYAIDLAGNRLFHTPSGTRSHALRVTGTHRPALSFHYALLPGGGFRIHGRAYFTDTRRPIARLPLATQYGSNCDMDGGAVNDIVTDARGRYEKRWPTGETSAAGCVALIGPASPEQRPTLLAYHIGWAPTPSIPDAAMLQPEDLGGATPTPVDGDAWRILRPPMPCGDRAYPSVALFRAQRAVSVLLGVDDRPTVVVEHLATYRSTGARQYLRELRHALVRHGGCDTPDREWTLLATGVAGPGSMLIRMRERIEYGGETLVKDTYLAVARVHRAVVVLADVGWETGHGHEALVRRLITVAVRRASTLR
ncbi:MAG TPA: hypothetical protein VNV66_05085 [Pilimelia sp.]|nr:hypothetical protein [Pilimelia sp.]